ncbi:hypothetical protein CONLIGDRAFT_271645 [Coniochaeta ligniaria NRRL 30616]|uniref:Uncharacterized protein n=1 Tax=Coniochaeta ligniaria NRRL 30616 TaxID=1408157 RepID=A0A1J7JXG5_9PEZI|nr:hypothetical protein CONLIGDRAFT_271645 [Coniochaeta ligniaria NRRL 30616]
MEFDSPAQYERDLRGANQEWKRHKDSTRKWRLGEAPSAGVSWDWITNTPTGGSEAQQKKVRPITAPGNRDPWKDHHNIVKLSHSGNHGLSQVRVKSKMGIQEELEAATRSGDLLGGSDVLTPGGLANDPFLYSFDRSVTPGQPLTLDVFVKAPTARDTERLVEKEYEVVDENGQALRGREAKRNLRKSSSNLAAEKSVDDGFELV